VKIEEDKEEGEGSWSGTTKQNKIKLKKDWQKRGCIRVVTKKGMH